VPTPTRSAAQARALEEIGASGSTQGAAVIARDLPARLAGLLEALDRAREA